jgi:general secretion pathway protein D
LGALFLCCWGLIANVALAGGGGGGARGGGGGIGGVGGGVGGAAARGGGTGYASSTSVGTANLMVDQETRTIVGITDPVTAEKIRQVIASIDRRAPQVLIKCVFMEATYSKGTDYGVKGTYKHTISSKIPEFNTPAGQNNTASTAFNLAASGGLYSMLGKDLEITVAALAQAGRTEILSRPSILARNNQVATITIGQQVPLISGVTYDSFGNQRNAITYQSVGIILQVTPFITSDGMVEMVVAPQISSVSDSTVSFATGSGTNGNSSASAPIINIRSADTMVVVPDGQTVVIGGLMSNQKVSSEEKVPILGDIPLLGLLFKHKKTDDEKKELLIFMTPHIVKDPRDLAAVTGSERVQTQIAPNAFSEQELNRYLDGLPAKESDPAKDQEGRDNSGFKPVPPPSKQPQP